MIDVVTTHLIETFLGLKYIIDKIDCMESMINYLYIVDILIIRIIFGELIAFNIDAKLREIIFIRINDLRLDIIFYFIFCHG